MPTPLEHLLERRHTVMRAARQYYEFPFHVVRGEGQWLYDASGRRYLDAYNNVAHVGHCHPRVVEALCKQARTLNTNTRYLSEPVVEYAERLIATIGSGYACMFTCTGSEANDLAWRLASTFTGNTGVITTEHCYHGNTTFLDLIDGSSTKASGSTPVWWAKVPAPKTVLFDGVERAAPHTAGYARYFEDAIATLKSNGVQPAAFFFDSYFCTDGVFAPPTGLMADAIKRVREAGGLIVVDEVQGGLGRPGTHMWGFQRLGIEADIVVMGKPMGNGHPIGVVVARSDIIDRFFSVDRYFNTFAGNPVSCAAGIAVLDVIQAQRLQENATNIGDRLKHAFIELAKRYPMIGAVRGEGLLLGVELVNPGESQTPAGKQARWIINELCRRGVIVGLTGTNRTARNVLKIRPPMIFNEADCDVLMSALADTLSDLDKTPSEAA
jgi:4-aminobutyrate aminotransferase-like enzyme